MVSGTVRVFSALFTLSLVTMLALAGMGAVVFNHYERPGPLEAARTVFIPKGGRIDTAQLLEEQGIIDNRWTFVASQLFQSWFGLKKIDLKAGEYEIKEHASMREVMTALSDGRNALAHKFTLPEGLTSQQIVERIKGEPNLSGEIATTPAEGTLMPDTYLITKGMGRQELVDQMQKSMREFIAATWEKRKADLPLRTIEDAVTFAYIVEKETGKPDERDKVAAVFHNRLKKGMRLQSDPTIIYGIAGGAGTIGRGITKADIESKTPYNTYTINGLPPGPICNPGKASLTAALNPAQTNDIYFVADGTGGHAFSETLKAHNTAVQKWREAEKQAKAKEGGAQGGEVDPDVAPIPESAAEPEADPAADPAAGTDKGKVAKAKEAAAAPSAGTASAVTPASASSIPLPQRKPKKQ